MGSKKKKSVENKESVQIETPSKINKPQGQMKNVTPNLKKESNSCENS